MKCLYKYPAARSIPYARLIEENRRRAAAGPGVRAARHRHLRRRPLLRHRRRVRQGDARGHLHPDRGVQPRAGGRRRCTSCRTSGSATPGPGAPTPGAEPVITAGTDGPTASSVSLADDSDGGAAAEPAVRLPARPAAPLRRGRRRAAVHGQRDERAARSAGPGAAAASRTSRTPSTATSSTASDCVNPDAGRHQGGAPLSARRVPPGGSVVLRLRLTTETLDAARSPTSTRSSTSAATRPTSSTRRSTRRRPPRTRGCVQRQALAGMLWTQADLPVRRRPAGSTATTRDWPPPGVAAAHPQQHWRHLNSMRILSMPDKWEYPWFAAWDLAFHCVAARAGRPASSPRSSSGSCSSSSSSIPTARSPPTSGSSPT